MGMIIKPQGPSVYEIIIEIDGKGSGLLKAHAIVGSRKLPMNPLLVSKILCQMLANVLGTLGPTEGQNQNGASEKSKDSPESSD